MDKFTPKLVPELYVTDLQKSLKFYIGTLGFSIKYAREEDGFAYLDMGSAQLMLEQIDPAYRTWIPAEMIHPFGRGINFQIEVPDVETLYLKLQSINYPIYLSLEEKWYRANDIQVGNRQFIVADPDGYLLRFFTDLGDKPASRSDVI